jgi:hypothetical protein
MPKQTAVEWLIDNLHYLHSTKWDDILEKAKEMEKQQIMDARIDGDMNSRCISHLSEKYAELYYLETYGGKDA